MDYRPRVTRLEWKPRTEIERKQETSKSKCKPENRQPEKRKREMTGPSARGHKPQRLAKGFSYARQKKRPRRGRRRGPVER